MVSQITSFSLARVTVSPRAFQNYGHGISSGKAERKLQKLQPLHARAGDGRDNPAGNFTLEDGILDCGWTWKASKEYYGRVARELEKMGEAMGSVCGAMPTRRTW